MTSEIISIWFDTHITVNTFRNTVKRPINHCLLARLSFLVRRRARGPALLIPGWSPEGSRININTSQTRANWALQGALFAVYTRQAHGENVVCSRCNGSAGPRGFNSDVLVCLEKVQRVGALLLESFLAVWKYI